MQNLVITLQAPLLYLSEPASQLDPLLQNSCYGHSSQSLTVPESSKSCQDSQEGQRHCPALHVLLSFTRLCRHSPLSATSSSSSHPVSPRICHLPGHFILSFRLLGSNTLINSTNGWDAGRVPACHSDKTEISAVYLPGGADRQQAVNIPVLEVNVCSRQTQKEIRHARLTGEGGSLNGVNWGGATQSRLEGGKGVDHANIRREKECQGQGQWWGCLYAAHSGDDPQASVAGTERL